MRIDRTKVGWGLSALFILGEADVFAGSSQWTGATDTRWTNAQNWAAAPYPGSGDTAYFSGAGNGRTNLITSGLSVLKSITFDGPAVASYTLGDGSAGDAALPLQNGGILRLSDSVRAGQRIQAALEIGADTNSAGYTIQNDSPWATLTLAGTMQGSASGRAEAYKTLTFSGIGNTLVSGNLLKNSAATLTVAANGAGTLTLSGTNSFTALTVSSPVCGAIDVEGQTSLANGGSVNLTAYQDCVVYGAGSIVLSTGGGENYSDNSVAAGKTMTINCRLTGSSGFEYWTMGNTGTFLLNGSNDFTGNIVINSTGTIGTQRIGNQGSTTSGFGAGTFFRFNADGATLLYIGVGETTDRLLQIYANAVVDQSGTGILRFASPVTVSAGNRTLTLQGSADGIGDFAGTLRNDSGVLALAKAGTGTWCLSTNDTFTGATAVNGGALVLTNATGALSATAAVSVSNSASLVLANTAAANSADRLNNAAPVTLAGGTLALANDGGAADFSETVGAVTVTLNANTIAASQAAPGQASTLTLTSLARTGGTLNFVGTGLGLDTRNRILIVGQTNGLIGTWAFYNGKQLAAYDSTLGVIPAADSAHVDIAALGPGSVISNAPNGTVRISTTGTSGAIAVNDASTTINALFQNTATAATLDTANKTLSLSMLRIAADQASVTVGSTANDGRLSSATAGGTLILANDSTNGTLTVNAAVTNNGTSTALIKLGPGTVALAGASAYTGTTFIAVGTLTFSGATATQTLTSAVAGPGDLVKSGTGALTLASGNSYAGSTRILAGTVIAQNSAAFGSSANGTVIAPGATLDLGGSLAADALVLGLEPFSVSGTGVNGLGAIVNTSARSQNNAISRIALTGDTTFGGVSRWDIRNVLPTLALNGFTLTKTGNNEVGLVSTVVTPGTGTIDVAQGSLRLESSTGLGGSFTNTMTVRTGATLNLYNLAVAPVWTLALSNNATLNASLGYSPLNAWAGPVSAAGTVVLGGISGASLTLSGPVSGSGSLVKIGAGSTAFLTGNSNVYSGTTIVSNGTLFAAAPGSLPGYDSAGRVAVANGATLALQTGDGATGWGAASIDALRGSGAFATNTAVLALDTTLGDFAYAGNFGDPLALTKQGNNVLTLSGVNTYSGVTRINGGSRAALTFAAASSNVLGGNIYLNGGASGAALNISGTVSLANLSDFYVGNNVGDRGTVAIAAPFTLDDFQIGWISGAHGAIYHTSGAMTSRVLSPGATAGGYGYYRLNGGKATVTGYLEVGTYGTGVMEVVSGSLVANNCFDLARRPNGMGVLIVSGGTVTAPSNGNPIQIGRNDANAANGQICILGSGSLNTANASTSTLLDLSASTNPATAFGAVNLLGGSLTANRVGSTRGGTTLVNFNGGALRVASGTAFATNFLDGLTAANVYPGGAVLDTSNITVTVAQSLLAPGGYGVAALTVTNAGAGYIGAPAVVLSGGSGTGATAIATVDLDAASATYGQLTGLTVTSPGFGYRAGDTVAVVLCGGGYTTPANATASLSANASGGLTKLGSGTLILKGTNTYAGTTTISNGTLRLGHAAALSANSSIAVAGGTFDLNGFTATNGSVSVLNGTVVNGTVSGSSFALGNAAAIFAALDGNAALSVVNGGTATVYAAQTYTGATTINGTLNLLPRTAGLYEGSAIGAFNTVASNPGTSIQNTTRYANTTTWPSVYTTFIYSGYIWNRATTNVAWTFAENFDDSVLLKIDGATVLNNGTWNAPTIGTCTLTPGAHAFEARFGQGDGGVGPVNGTWWQTNAFGFGVDFFGRNDTNIANYAALTDPGDGSLLTIENFALPHTNLLTAGTSVALASGSLLNLCGNVQTLGGLSGNGTVSNGTLIVNGTIAPGGTNVIGSLAIAATTTLSGTLLADVATDGSGDQIVVTGDLSLTALNLVIANPAQLNRKKAYTLIACSGSRIGKFSSVTVPDNRWHVAYATDGAVKLFFSDGTLIQMR